MTYEYIDESLPADDAAGTDAFAAIRRNTAANMDAAVIGTYPYWGVSVSYDDNNRVVGVTYYQQVPGTNNPVQATDTEIIAAVTWNDDPQSPGYGMPSKIAMQKSYNRGAIIDQIGVFSVAFNPEGLPVGGNWFFE